MTVNGHPPVLPCLSEYTSRQCRMRLAQICLEAASSADMGLSDPSGYIAGQLTVTKRTVRRWRGGGIQSCNVNADKLIELAYRLAPEDTDAALREDLELHRVTYLNGQGAVRLHSTKPQPKRVVLGGEKPGLLTNSGVSSETPRAAPATPQEDTA